MAAIVPYTPDLEPAVAAFNERIRRGGSPFWFQRSSVPEWLPRRDGLDVYEEYFVVVDGGVVRGGYILKRQPFLIRGERKTVGCLMLPLSEGSVSPAHGAVALQLLTSALGKSPLLFSLGMGGFHNAYPKLLRAAGFAMELVPFYFRVVRPAAFLRNIRPLRRTRIARALLDAAAASGAGALALGSLFSWIAREAPPGVSADLVPVFGVGADSVWERARAGDALVAERNAATLNALYPSTDPRHLRLEVRRGGAVAGWAVVRDTAMTDHKHFAAMRLGSIVDAVAEPGAEPLVAQAATRFLEERGVDLVVSNQSHRAWRGALRRAGFLRGPSNFVFAASKPLARAIGGGPRLPLDAIHMTRGDGEGPTHL